MSNQGDAEAAVPGGSKVMKVVTSDGKEFEVSTKILKMFNMVKDMLALGEGGGAIDLEDDKPFQLPQVRGEIFAKILEWCEWHQDDPETSDDADSDDEDRDRRIDDIPQWDVKFIAKMSRSDVYETMQACNYLDLQYMLELLAKTVAGWMKGKSVEEIRSEFNIECDYTPEEDERLKRENAWAEEAVLKLGNGP